MKEVFIKLPDCNKERMRGSSMILTTIILVLLAVGFVFSQSFCILVATALLAIGLVFNADVRGMLHV